VLEGFGFERVNVAVEESPYALAHEAASRLLDEQQVDPASIGLLVCGGTPSAMAFFAATDGDAGAASLCTADRFRYPATRLQHELGRNRGGPGPAGVHHAVRRGAGARDDGIGRGSSARCAWRAIYIRRTPDALQLHSGCGVRDPPRECVTTPTPATAS
jgi:hypothetical protein